MYEKQTTYTNLQVTLDNDGNAIRTIVQSQTEQLPQGDVLIRVQYSSLNYKDALSASGNKGVTRHYPHTPGIDAAGVVVQSTHAHFCEGDAVLVTGYDLGMNTNGGFAQYIRVPASWVVPMPCGLDARTAMIYGTAGFTAAQSVHIITQTCTPADGEIVITGARGGVGSIAVAILAKLGYQVVAATRFPDKAHDLFTLGASSVISNDELIGDVQRPLAKSRWAGGIDTVGGDILAGMLKSANPRSTITCCGNAASISLPISVFPFILRGITLHGIDSQNCPMKIRLEIWEKLANQWKIPFSNFPMNETTIDKLETHIVSMLKGLHSGRTLVQL